MLRSIIRIGFTAAYLSIFPFIGLLGLVHSVRPLLFLSQFGIDLQTLILSAILLLLTTGAPILRVIRHRTQATMTSTTKLQEDLRETKFQVQKGGEHILGVLLRRLKLSEVNMLTQSEFVKSLEPALDKTSRMVTVTNMQKRLALHRTTYPITQTVY